MKKYIKLLKEAYNEYKLNYVGGKEEFVDFDPKEFEGYYEYDKANPNRFEVRYDANGNRLWHKEN